MPLVIRIMHTREGQPETGSPKISFLTMINTIIRKAITQNRIPTKEAISSGAVEKAVIPSMEYTSSFQKFHLVSPLARSTFSYSSHLVQKKYKDKEAVRKFNYTFTNGVYGLLGENGAGKTTLMRLICGVLQPTGGSIYCDDIEIDSMGAEYRRLLGYLPQDFGYYGDFTAERFLRYMAALKALPEDYADSRIDELLDMVELKNVKKKKLKTFSGGMIRRIGIAQALLNNPEILILDEPTAGLDPKERVRFRNVISSLGKNRMVLLSTHIVSDIDYIADRILIMKNGELIQEGTEKEITDKVEGCVWKCIVSEKEAGQITSSFIVSNMRSRGENVELRIVSERQPVAGAENVESTLEDAYLYHTQITGGEKNATL